MADRAMVRSKLTDDADAGVGALSQSAQNCAVKNSTHALKDARGRFAGLLNQIGSKTLQNIRGYDRRHWQRTDARQDVVAHGVAPLLNVFGVGELLLPDREVSLERLSERRA